ARGLAQRALPLVECGQRGAEGGTAHVVAQRQDAAERWPAPGLRRNAEAGNAVSPLDRVERGVDEQDLAPTVLFVGDARGAVVARTCKDDEWIAERLRLDTGGGLHRCRRWLAVGLAGVDADQPAFLVEGPCQAIAMQEDDGHRIRRGEPGRVIAD